MWAVVTWNDTLKRKYEIMFVLAEIICVQCVSHVGCERDFLFQNCINTKHHNLMLMKNLESVLRIALKDLIEGCHDIFKKAMGLRNDHMKFKYLFFHPKRYLFGLGGMEIDEYP